MSEFKDSKQFILDIAYDSIAQLERARELAQNHLFRYTHDCQRMDAWELIACLTELQAKEAKARVEAIKKQREPPVKLPEPHPMRCGIKCGVCPCTAYIRINDTAETINKCRVCGSDNVTYKHEAGRSVDKETILERLIR